jgi:polyisoprenoid-binding protein YceI
MPRKKLGILLCCLIGTCVLISCVAAPQPVRGGAATAVQAPSVSWKATYSGLAQSGGKVYQLDPKQSAIRIFAFRGGRAAKVGHNHVLSAPSFTGFAFVASSGVAESRFDIEFRLDQLEIDNPEYRGALGAAFASFLSKEAIDGTREHMLGEDNFQADRFPYVQVHGLQLSGEAPKLAAKVQFELHGQQREVWVPLTAEFLPDRIVVSGSFILRQSDFGVHPYTVLGGLLAVQDEVVVEFKLTGI